MKGIYGEPESTGDELPNGMLGNYDAPTNWPKTVIFNPQGDVPGPLIQWGDPQIPSIEAGYGFTGNGKPENNQYFYHSDHLGSTSYITDRQGNAEQFIVYMPYGEVLTEEHGNWESPYKFNGKEQDAETGLYYYGARYYEPNVAMWYGVDPMAEKYPNVGGYVYCHNSPVNLIDPDGMDDYINEQGKKVYSDGRTTNNIRTLKNEDWERIQYSYHKEIADKEHSYSNLLSDLDASSKIITFENAGADFAALWKSGSVNEAAGLFVFDFNNANVYFEQIPVQNATPTGAYQPYKAGDKYNGGIVLGNAHTHPTEHTYLGTFTDSEIFNAQYRGDNADGNRAVGNRTIPGQGANYTIGKYNVDYFSPQGRSSSINNITTRSNLENNKGINLLKHAFQQYVQKQ
jgi:RHS repeat-associated protein